MLRGARALAALRLVAGNRERHHLARPPEPLQRHHREVPAKLLASKLQLVGHGVPKDQPANMVSRRIASWASPSMRQRPADMEVSGVWRPAITRIQSARPNSIVTSGSTGAVSS